MADSGRTGHRGELVWAGSGTSKKWGVGGGRGRCAPSPSELRSAALGGTQARAIRRVECADECSAKVDFVPAAGPWPQPEAFAGKGATEQTHASPPASAAVAADLHHGPAGRVTQRRQCGWQSSRTRPVPGGGPAHAQRLVRAARVVVAPPAVVAALLGRRGGRVGCMVSALSTRCICSCAALSCGQPRRENSARTPRRCHHALRCDRPSGPPQAKGAPLSVQRARGRPWRRNSRVSTARTVRALGATSSRTASTCREARSRTVSGARAAPSPARPRPLKSMVHTSCGRRASRRRRRGKHGPGCARRASRATSPACRSQRPRVRSAGSLARG